MKEKEKARSREWRLSEDLTSFISHSFHHYLSDQGVGDENKWLSTPMTTLVGGNLRRHAEILLFDIRLPPRRPTKDLLL